MSASEILASIENSITKEQIEKEIKLFTNCARNALLEGDRGQAERFAKKIENLNTLLQGK